MTISSKKIFKNIGDCKIRLTLPSFEEENNVSRSLSAFYDKIAETIESSTVSGGFNAISEFFVPCCTEEIVSIAVDLFLYQNNTLINCLRFSSTRSKDGFEIIPPKKLSKKIPKNGGWYYDGDSAVIYKNSFSLGDEARLRRSEYHKLFHEIKTEIKLDLF